MALSTTKTPKVKSSPRQELAPESVSTAPASMPASHALIIDLQRTIGNRAVQCLLNHEPQQAVKPAPAEPTGVSLAEMQEIAHEQPGFAAFGVPEPKTMGEVRELHGEEMKAGSWVLGFTTIPRNYTVPTFNLNVKIDPGPKPYQHWYGEIVPLARADMGETRVYYVKAGKYDTGLKTRGMPIRAVVSEEIAASGRAAEMEHTADYTYAYNITLLAADYAIQQLMANRIETHFPEGGYTDESVARSDIVQSVIRAFKNLVPRLGPNSDAWGQLYQDRFNRTGIRDRKRWHTHSDNGLEPTDGSELIYNVNKGDTRIDVTNPGSNSAEIVDWNSSL